ncbi:MAG: ABC transporter substrate-binding protein [Candidatus Rokubacteria bacterium]|nr:ABC transporter substrate-binding protein [Candidatus Rokubacteria bacterium]
MRSPASSRPGAPRFPGANAIRPLAAPAVGHAAEGATYRRILRGDPVTLDPARIADAYGRSVAQQIFDGLVQFDQTLTVVPALAKHWKASRDGLTWTFTLRPDVKCHHGREVTADDVVYSFTRLLDPAVKSGAADLFSSIRGAVDFQTGRAPTVSGLTALDRYTVQVVLSQATGSFVSAAAVGHAKIVPREVVEQHREGFGSRPVGTGPFKFTGRERNREITLGANAEYFDGPPRLGRIVDRIYTGERADAIYDDFKRGELEDAPPPTHLSATEFRRVATDPTHVYVKRSLQRVRFYGFNVKAKPLDSRLVRQAISHAIDREEIIEDLQQGRVLTARGILPPGMFAYNPKLSGYAYDPARARALRAQAGFPEGRGLAPVTIWSTVKDDRVLREHELIRKNLAAVGIRVEFQYQTDWPTFSRQLNERKFPGYLYAWFADVPDPDSFLSKLFNSTSRWNYTGYANPAVDALLAEGRRTREPLQRAEVYRRAEQLIMDDAPVLPIWHYVYERLFQPYVRDVEVSSFGDPYIPFRKVWLDRPR